MSHPTIDAVIFLQEIYPSSTAVIIDVRTPSEFSALSLPNSKNIPLDQLNPEVLEELNTTAKGVTVYLLCGTGMRAKKAHEKLSSLIDCPMLIIEGGINELQRREASLEQGKKAAWSLERQVRIAAGFLVILGVVAGLTLNPLFFGLSAFVGLGLMFAGITDSCGMAMTLAKMPWNKKPL